MILNKTSKYTGNARVNPEDYISDVDSDLNTIFLALAGRIRFGIATDGKNGENIAGQFQVVADSGSINTEFNVVHTLGSVPVGFLVFNINAGGVVYASGTTWTSTNVYFKCSAANAAITLFLLK